MLLFPAHHGEQIQLPFQIAAGVGLDAFEDALYRFHHTVSVGAKAVKGTCFDQAFHRAAVQLAAVHPLAEIIKAGVGLFPALGDCVLDEVAAYVFHRVQAKTNLTVVIGGKAAVGDVHIRRQHLDAQTGALAGILDDLIRIVQHTGEQCCHELAGVMALEVSGLKSHISVAGGVALVEGVGRKAGHLVVDLVCHLLRDAVGNAARAFVTGLRAAVHKVLPLCFHDGVLLFAHGAADVICLPEGEACQLPEDLHDLLLIDDAAVGHIQNVRQLRGLVADLVRLVPVAQIGGNGVHGTRAVQADQSDDIFKVLGLQAHKHLLHAGGFQLEHALGIALAQHFIGVRVVIIQITDGKLRVLLLHRNLCVPDDGQGAQTQKVHLQKTQLFDLGHVELGHRQAIVGGKRQIIIGRLRRDDHARRVGGGVPGHSLHLQGGVDQLGHLRVGIVELFQLTGNFQRPLEGHFQFHGHKLCHHIHLLVRDTHHAAHIPDGVAGSHSTKGDDLRHMVRTVFTVDVVDDLLPALVAEVHIEIRHTDALGVQKTLEDQVIADGVDIRDAHAVGGDTTRAGAASRSHRDALTFCKIDVVPHNEVVVGIPHGLDHTDLVFQAVDVGLRHVRAVAAFQAVPAKLFKVGLIVHAVRGFVVRDLGVAELKVKITLLGDLCGVGTGFRHHGEQLVHLVGGLDVEFIGLEFHTVGILNGLTGLDAQQNALHLGVLFAQIMGVVGGCHGNARLPGKLDKLRQNGGILLQAMILQFDIVILCTEQIPVPQRRCLCALVVPCQNSLRDLARQTGRKADKPLVVLLQKLLIHAWLGIKALHKTGRDHFDQVLVTGLVFAE